MKILSNVRCHAEASVMCFILAPDVQVLGLNVLVDQMLR